MIISIMVLFYFVAIFKAFLLHARFKVYRLPRMPYSGFIVKLSPFPFFVGKNFSKMAKYIFMTFSGMMGNTYAQRFNCLVHFQN